jgi:ribose transport system substrate-binding protein
MKIVLMLLVLYLFSGIQAQDDGFVLGLSLPAGEDHPYYGLVLEEAQTTADEAGVELMILSAENDLEAEAANIETFVEEDVDLLLFAPVHPVESTSALEPALEADIPVILLGSAVETERFAAVVDASDEAKGELAATTLCEMLGETGTIVELVEADIEIEATPEVTPEATDESEETIDIVTAFHDTLAETCPDVELTPLDVSGLEREAVQQAFMDVLTSADVNGVIGYRADTILPAMEATIIRRSRGITLISFGIDADLLGGVQNGRLTGLISIEPLELGKTGIEVAVAYLHDEDFEIDIAPVVLNAELLTSSRCRKRGGCG